MKDVERLRRDVSLVDVVGGNGVKLQKNGGEWEGCCPFHSEDTPSFTVFPGREDSIWRFHCFGCGEGGDVLDFVQKIKGVNLPEAIKILGGGKAGPNVAPKVIEPRDPYKGIKLLVPDGEIEAGKRVRVWNPKRETSGSFAPSMVFPYFRPDGQPLGYVLRHDLRDGDKETPMVCWVELPNGDRCWSRFPFPKPRPLYGIEKLRDGQVIIVEGEKCVDALRRSSGRIVVSWAGGTHGVAHADWSPLAGRSVVIWPDADEPGIKTAQDIARLLTAMDCKIKVLDVMGAAA